MSYLRYLCLFAYSGVCFWFVCLRPVSCVTYVTNFSRLSNFFISPSMISNVYFLYWRYRSYYQQRGCDPIKWCSNATVWT
jgi:hypothetical protein